MATGILNSDVLIELLSRLPAKSLLRFKCVSKGWHTIISDVSFWRLQSKRSEAVLSGYFFKDYFYCPLQAKYLPISFDQTKVRCTMLDFLPERVTLVGSRNGLLCCLLERINCCSIYVCNPATKEYVQIEWPKDVGSLQGFELAFDPIYESIDLSNFKLVSASYKDPGYFFQIYSSEREEWRTLKECLSQYHGLYGVCSKPGVLINGVLYWLTANGVSSRSTIFSFDIRTEKGQILILPVKNTRLYGRERYNVVCEDCIGESEGLLHYIRICDLALRVWVLSSEFEWFPKHVMSLTAMEEKYPHFPYNDAKNGVKLLPIDLCMPRWIDPLVFKNDNLLLKLRTSFSNQNDDKLEHCSKIYPYDLQAGTMITLCTLDELDIFLGFLKAYPYSMSLALSRYG